jgi:hypothetical protein
MKSKLSRPKSAGPTAVRRRGPRSTSSGVASAPAAIQQYKVIELSTVDEISLERALNDWVGRGWRLDGIHFAMRDSSKRPAMAFVLFTRPAGEAVEQESEAERSNPRPLPQLEYVSTDPWRRLRQLAGVEAADDESGDPTSE